MNPINPAFNDPERLIGVSPFLKSVRSLLIPKFVNSRNDSDFQTLVNRDKVRLVDREKVANCYFCCRNQCLAISLLINCVCTLVATR